MYPAAPRERMRSWTSPMRPVKSSALTLRRRKFRADLASTRDGGRGGVIKHGLPPNRGGDQLAVEIELRFMRRVILRWLPDFLASDNCYSR